MCHNADLVLRPGELETLPENSVWDFLARRAGMVDGVVITGGEPTLQADLPRFLRQIREIGLDAKLDTNGHHPDVLETLLVEELVTYVALDVKAPPEKYPAELYEAAQTDGAGRRQHRIRVSHHGGTRAARCGRHRDHRPLDQRGQAIRAPAVQAGEYPRSSTAICNLLSPRCPASHG